MKNNEDKQFTNKQTIEYPSLNETADIRVINNNIKILEEEKANISNLQDVARESSPKNIENKVNSIDAKATTINNGLSNVARETTPKNIENKVINIDTKTTTMNNSINTINTNVTNVNNGLSNVAKESSPKNIENSVKSLQNGMSDLLTRIINLENEIKNKGTSFPTCQVIDFFNVSSTKVFYSTFSEINVNIKANQTTTQETTKTIKIDNNTKVLTKLYMYYTPLENVLIVPFENFNTKQINLRVSNLNNKDVSVRVSLFFHYIEV